MEIKGSNILISACVCVLLYLACSQIIHTNWSFRVIVFILISIVFIAKLEDKISNKPVVEKKPNIMVEAFKSIWSKVCPIIEIVDDETI